MEEILKQLQLNKKQSTLLLSLYKLGRATPAELSKDSSLNRSTVYVVLNELLDKKMIIQDISSKKQIFVALHPDELLGLIPIMEKELEIKKTALQDLAKELKEQLLTKNLHIPKITFIREDQLESYLYTRTPIWNKSMIDTGTDYIGYFDHTFSKKYQEWIEWYWNHPSTKYISLRLLTNENQHEENVMKKKLPERRNIKYWEETGELTYSTWVNGEYTIMLNTRVHPYSVIEIHDPLLAQSQRQIFEVMWKSAGKI